MKVRSARRAVALVGVLALLLAACGDDGDDSDGDGDEAGGGDAPATEELTSIEVGVVPVVDVAPLYLGIDQGFFEEEGLDVEPVVAQGGAAIIPAVVNGDQEIGFSNIVSLLIGQTEACPSR